jgi:hypothetical protein
MSASATLPIGSTRRQQRQCIWRQGADVKQPRCTAVFTPWNHNQVCCNDHSTAYNCVTQRVRRLLREAASE